MNILRRKEKKRPQEASATSDNNDLTHPAPPPTPDDVFEARPSSRAPPAEADGDTWVETLAVCEVSGEITVRSYFTNQRTSERIWDEPPSGASTVQHATEEMRRMAQAQLSEMQIVAGTITQGNNSSQEASPKPRAFGGLFGGRNKNKNKGSTSRGKIQYKPGSILAGKKKQQFRGGNNESLDPHVQAAIALSMAEQSGVTNSSFEIMTGTKNNKNTEYQQEQDEDLAMAMALSLSENHALEDSKTNVEDDLLGLAATPPKTYDETMDPKIMATVGPPPNLGKTTDTASGPPPVSTATSGDLLGLNETAGNQATSTTQPPPNAKQWPPQSQEETTNTKNNDAAAPNQDNSNLKTWPPPPPSSSENNNVDHALQKLSPDQGQRKSRLSGMIRRLSKKNVESEAGVL